MSRPLLCVLSRDLHLYASLSVELVDIFELAPCESLDEAQAFFQRSAPWGLVADFRSLNGRGHAEVQLLDRVDQQFPTAEVFVLTAALVPEPLDRRLACSRSVRLMAPVDAADLSRRIRSRLVKEASAPASPPQVDATPPAAVDSSFMLTGLTRRFETNTPRLQMMLSDLEIAAKHDVTVLLIGETGSGKTFLSRLIHEISPRRNEPFLPVACGALPSELIESELFGHVKGAFTSAHADKDGKFVAARRGTILLDEIDVLGLEQQVKLLRAIESGEFEPVGSNRTLKSEARLIVASNLDLQPLVEQGKFRPDLYYRLNMLKFELLPLRARRADIVPLARKFVVEQSQKHHVQVTRIDDSLFAALMRYPWPGNVRELEHVIQRAVIYCSDGVLTAHHLPSHVVMCIAGPGNEGRPLDDYELPPQTGRSSLGHQVALSEREIIEQALFKNNYRRTSTAKSLGISRVTLYNKMKKYGITK